MKPFQTEEQGGEGILVTDARDLECLTDGLKPRVLLMLIIYSCIKTLSLVEVTATQPLTTTL